MEAVDGGAPATFAYAYDANGQLVEVRKNGAVVDSYAYDANGNRTHRLVGGEEEVATFDVQDRLVMRGTVAYEYDAAGFMTKRGWRDAATPGLIEQRAEAGLGHRDDLVTFFDLMDVEEGRMP